AMAVGMLRVACSMLPPSMSEAPTSATTRANAAMIAASRPKRTSRITVHIARAGDAPSVRAVSQARRSAPASAAWPRASSSGNADDFPKFRIARTEQRERLLSRGAEVSHRSGIRSPDLHRRRDEQRFVVDFEARDRLLAARTGKPVDEPHGALIVDVPVARGI